MAKLGTSKRPAIVRVHSIARAEDILSVCDARGWKVIVGVEPDKPEDVSDIESLLAESAPSGTVRQERRVGRNSRCPCRSGRRFKNCCQSR